MQGAGQSYGSTVSQTTVVDRDYSENDILLAHKNTLPFLHTTLAKVGRGHLLKYSICLVDTPLPLSFAICGFLEER